MDCPSTSVCTAPSVDDYDFSSKKPHRRDALPPAVTSYQKFVSRLLPKRTAAGPAPFRIVPPNQSHRWLRTCASGQKKQNTSSDRAGLALRRPGTSRQPVRFATHQTGAPLVAHSSTVQNTKFDMKSSADLQADYVLRLQTLRPLLHFKFHRLTLVKGLVTLRLDRGEMHEYIRARMALGKPVALGRIKPLPCTLLSAPGNCS